MNMVEPDELTLTLVDALMTRAHNNGPAEFRAWLCGGILASAVAALPDGYWAQMMKVEPCKQPGCDCHKEMEQMMVALNEQRNLHRRILPPTRTE